MLMENKGSGGENVIVPQEVLSGNDFDKLEKANISEEKQQENSEPTEQAQEQNLMYLTQLPDSGEENDVVEDNIASLKVEANAERIPKVYMAETRQIMGSKTKGDPGKRAIEFDRIKGDYIKKAFDRERGGDKAA